MARVPDPRAAAIEKESTISIRVTLCSSAFGIGNASHFSDWGMADAKLPLFDKGGCGRSASGILTGRNLL